MSDTTHQKRKRHNDDDLKQLKNILKSKEWIEYQISKKRAKLISDIKSIHPTRLYYMYIEAENEFIQTHTLLVNARSNKSTYLLDQYQETYWKAFIAKNNASSKYYKAKIKKYELNKSLTQTEIDLDVATIDVALAQEELDWFKLNHF